MGSSFSEENKRKIISQESIKSPDVMDAILKHMLQELSVRDFHALSNPSVCNKYVLFMANNIYKHFKSIKLFPYRNEKRILLFRKVDDLVNPSDDERQSLCLVLSYYYVRIFQIYGALALTLIDDVSFMTSSGLTTLPEQYGGSRELFYYKFIKSYIKDSIYDDERGYKLIYSGTSNTKCSVYFMPKSNANSDIYYGTFKLFLNDNKYYIESKITESAYNEYEFIISSIYYNKDDRRISIDTSNFSKIIVKKINSDQYTMDTMSVDTRLNNLFNNILNIILRYTDKDVSNKQTTSSDTVKELRLDSIIQNLTRVKPLGHCIARAMQLLRVEPLDNKYGVSHICKTNFLETSKGTSRSGIPKPGEYISTSPGLSSLANLFYDTINFGTPKLVIGTKQIDGSNETSFQQYVKFMKLMSIRFGYKEATSKFEDIKDIRDKEICKSTDDNIYIPYNASKQVFNIMKELFIIQANHAQRCGQILLMMFNIAYDSTGHIKITLSDNIKENGFPEIDRINHHAREVLIAYYSNCEYKYIEGMKLIMDSRVKPTTVIQPNTTLSKNVITTLQERSDTSVPQSRPTQMYVPIIPRRELFTNPEFIQPLPTATGIIPPTSVANASTDTSNIVNKVKTATATTNVKPPVNAKATPKPPVNAKATAIAATTNAKQSVKPSTKTVRIGQ